jgi:N-carbamoyl-L-amino-acid hydrolase
MPAFRRIVKIGRPLRHPRLPPSKDANIMDRRDFHRVVIGTLAGTAGAAAWPALLGSAPPPAAQGVRVNPERLARRLTALSAFGRNSRGGIDRVAYSDADVAARTYVQGIMREAGLEVRIDAAGNLIGRREGRDRSTKALVTGSHIDSVPEGGNFDGQVGSMGAIEVAHALADAGVRLRHPLAVVIFQNEENGKVGSKAIRGDDPATFLDLPTNSGRTVREGIRFIGGDPDRIADARWTSADLTAFLELHIEQGGKLEAQGIDIGVVQGIVGIERWAVTVEGFANHAGTTPMDQRRDALLAAARFVDAANRIVRSEPGRQVATVGTIAAEPGAANVIAGRASLTLEMRDLDLGRVERLFEAMKSEADSIGAATGTAFAFEKIYETHPAESDPRMQSLIEASAKALGLSMIALPSGAGHDAQEMAQLAPMGMIFVPSVGGISHSAEERTRAEDIVNGANVLLGAMLRLDAS